MSNESNFGKGTLGFGRGALQTLIKTDYGSGCSFNGIAGHGLQDHRGGNHDQVNLFQHGASSSGKAFRFFSGK